MNAYPEEEEEEEQQQQQQFSNYKDRETYSRSKIATRLCLTHFDFTDFFYYQFCGISVNFFEKTPNFNDLAKKSQSDHEISLVIRFRRVRTWNSLK